MSRCLFDVSAEPKPEAIIAGVSKFLVAALLLTGYTHAAGQPVARRVKVNGMQMYYKFPAQAIRWSCSTGAYMNIPAMGAIIPKLAKTQRFLRSSCGPRSDHQYQPLGRAVSDPRGLSSEVALA